MHELSNQRQVAICTNSWQKSLLKDPKMTKTKENQKFRKMIYIIYIYIYIYIYMPIIHLKPFVMLLKHCGVDFRGLHINTTSAKTYFRKKPNYKKTGLIGQKTAS